MALIIAVLSAMTYALQNVYMTKFYRSMDLASAIAFRGVSLGITMLPLLFFSNHLSHILQPHFALTLLGAALTGVCGNLFGSFPFRHFAVGVASALTQSCLVLVSALFGVFWLHEKLPSSAVFLVLTILLASCWLGFHQDTRIQISRQRAIQSLLSCILFGFFSGTSFTLMSLNARGSDPFLAAYTWEFSIGLMTFLFLSLREKTMNIRWTRIDRITFGKILLASSPTLIGSGCAALSLTLLPLAIVSAVETSQLVFSTLFSRYVHDEKLDWTQWTLMLVIMGAIASFNLVGSN